MNDGGVKVYQRDCQRYLVQVAALPQGRITQLYVVLSFR